MLKHYNKREKTANLLFKIVEYGAIAFGVNFFLPNSAIGIKTTFLGISIIAVIFTVALLVTPENKDKNE